MVQGVIGKGSYGVVACAIDTYSGEKVAIKKINVVFEHVSDATRILREIKLLWLLRHPDIVVIKHIMLPPSRREFQDVYVIFELMDSDLHQVIKTNDDLTPEHYQFFLYQFLRGLKYIHAENDCENRASASVTTTLHSPPMEGDGSAIVNGNEQIGPNKEIPLLSQMKRLMRCLRKLPLSILEKMEKTSSTRLFSLVWVDGNSRSALTDSIVYSSRKDCFSILDFLTRK